MQARHSNGSSQNQRPSRCDAPLTMTARKPKPFKPYGFRHHLWYVRTYGVRQWWKVVSYRPKEDKRGLLLRLIQNASEET